MVEPNLNNLIISYMMSFTVKYIYLLLSVLKEHKQKVARWRINTYLSIRRILRPAASTSISHLLLAITSICPAYYIENSFGFEALGHFTLAVSTIYIPSILFANSIGQVYFERATKTNKNSGELKILWMQTVRLPIIFGLSIYPIFYIYGVEIYEIIFGRDWRLSGEMASILTISALFSVISCTVDRTCLVIGNNIHGPLWHLSRAIGMLAICFLLRNYYTNIIHFVIIFSLTTSIFYSIDIFCQYKYSKTA
jgi:O-antigen/teichoic acid export membrane protein